MNLRSLLLVGVALLALAGTQCSRAPSGPETEAVDDIGRPSLAAPDEEGAGNCLSFPVIWSDGITKDLRGIYGEELFGGAVTYADDPNTPEVEQIAWYHQDDPDNVWQAESRDQLPFGNLEVSRIDWGDNLEAKAWYEGSVIRVELVMIRDLPAGEEMIGYQMLKLNDQMGLDEVWGTSGQTYLSTQATVYSGCARLTIQKLSRERDDPELSLTWDGAAGEWVGDIAETYFNGGVWELEDGPGYYSAELNVQGKCIYGYNWYANEIEDAAGDYRITFSLGNPGPERELNTYFTSATEVELPVEEEVEVLLASGGGGGGGTSDHAGGVAVIVPEHNLTYIDVRLLARSGGGGHGGRTN